MTILPATKYPPTAFAALLLTVAALAPAATPQVTPGDIDFARDVQPILSDNCYFCHGPDAGKRKSHLRLDVLDPKEGPFAEREGGAALVAGHPEKSTALARILSDDPEEKMPPPKSNRHLTPGQIDILKRWVAQGAKWGTHWSLVPPKRPPTPGVKDARWVRTPIDAFILARLEAEGLKPSPQATKETLIRRVTLDLTGLPPTPGEVDAFLADPSSDAYEKVVNRLLASPRYGERMVWEWLDVARYADTNGYQGDNVRTMWPWRDWAAKAMNDNLPFDQFTVKQIAGDLLPDATTEDKIATAFLRNHMINGEGGRIPEENRIDYVMDQAETVATTWLGLTVGCARCHDHKFDPISQKDYYALFAFFNNTPVTGGGGSGQTPPVIDFATAAQKDKAKALDADVKKRAADVVAIENEIFPHGPKETAADSPAAQKLSGNILATLKQAPEGRYLESFRDIVPAMKATEPKYAETVQGFLNALEARKQYTLTVPKVMVMQEMAKPRDSFILVKGSYENPADKVTADTPAALPPLPTEAKKNRLALARWLVSPEHPLMARVTVNRVWQQFFGTGLVKTAEDFGVQGEKPSHPELLDWLAVQFQGGGWDVKALHRLIVTSATYRQSSKVTPDLVERDPENRLLARGPRYRLPAFILRDQALAAGGLLVEKFGGPPVKPYQPANIWEEATFGQIKFQQDHGDALYRRSLYTFWRRIVGPTEFFDAATRQTCAIRQNRTNTPLHALTTLNDTTYVEAARALAQRVMTQETAADARIDAAYRLVLARHPTAKEQAVLRAALDRLKGQYLADGKAARELLSMGESKRDEKLDPAEHAAYTGLCLAILNLDEALTKE